MRIRWVGAARAEFLAALDWYEAERPGLGADFLGAVTRSIELIADQPHAWPAIGPTALGLRRFLVPRYPHGLVDSIDGDELVIAAVAHGSRRPGDWRSRLEE